MGLAGRLLDRYARIFEEPPRQRKPDRLIFGLVAVLIVVQFLVRIRYAVALEVAIVAFLTGRSVYRWWQRRR
jgi:hypothetical protein